MRIDLSSWPSQILPPVLRENAFHSLCQTSSFSLPICSLAEEGMTETLEERSPLKWGDCSWETKQEIKMVVDGSLARIEELLEVATWKTHWEELNPQLRSSRGRAGHSFILGQCRLKSFAGFAFPNNSHLCRNVLYNFTDLSFMNFEFLKEHWYKILINLRS